MDLKSEISWKLLIETWIQRYETHSMLILLLRAKQKKTWRFHWICWSGFPCCCVKRSEASFRISKLSNLFCQINLFLSSEVSPAENFWSHTSGRNFEMFLNGWQMIWINKSIVYSKTRSWSFLWLHTSTVWPFVSVCLIFTLSPPCLLPLLH